MAVPVQLIEVREAVRVRYDLPAFSANPLTPQYATKALVDTFINDSIRSYVGILQECEAEEYYTYEETVSTTSGQAWVPTDVFIQARFQAIRAVQWIRSSDCVLEVRRAQRGEWYRRSQAPDSWDGRTPLYELIRDRIYLMPNPNAVYQLRVFYIGVPADLAVDGATFDGGPGWKEWVVEDVCRKLCEKEEQDPGRFLRALEKAEIAIRTQCVRQTDEPTYSRRLLLRDENLEEEYYR